MRVHKPNERPIPTDLDEAFVILDGGPFWSASKNRSYRESMTAKLASVHDSLALNDLYLANDVEFPGLKSFKIQRDQLTERGFLFLWMYLEGYLQHLERTGRVSNPDYLSACFKRFEEQV